MWRSSIGRLSSSLPQRRRPQDRRRVAAVAVTGVAGIGLILTASPASAATGSFTAPTTDGVVYDGVTAGQTSVSIKAAVGYGLLDSGTATLTVSDPRYAQSHSDGCQWTADSQSHNGVPAGSVDLAATVALTGETYPSTCSHTTTGSNTYAGQLPVNGTWTATLSDSDGMTSATRTFTVAIAPAAPTGLSGTSPAPLQETIGWARNPELDTHLYEVLDGSGDSLGSYPASSPACNLMTCSATVTVGSGGAQSFRVEAFRRSAPTRDVDDPSTAGDLTATSAASTFTVQGPASSMSPGSGTTPGSGGEAASGGSGTTVNKANTTGRAAKSGRASAPVAPKAPATGALTLGHSVDKSQAAKLSAAFAALAPPVALASLPPLPVLAGSATPVPIGTAAPDPADGEPTDQGTYKRKLGYAPQSTTTAVTTTTVPLTSVADAIGVSPVGLWRSVAASLLLLLGAAHVRRFARASPD